MDLLEISLATPSPGCATCDDSGEVYIDMIDARGEHYTKSFPCPECCEPLDEAYDYELSREDFPDEW